MELRHLMLVKTLAESGTLTAAGKELHLTQPALSRQLRSVEDELGVTLFHRMSKRMMLTHAGEILYSSARKILCELEKTENNLHNVAHGQVGKLRLATGCYTCYHWLPKTLEKYRKIYPGIETTINLAATADPHSALLSGELDLALVNRRVDSPELEYQPLFEDEDIVIVNRQHRWATRKYVMPEELADENLFVFDSNLYESNLFKKILNPAGVVPRQIVRLPMTEAMIEMVKAGLGISVMVRWAASPYLKVSDNLVPLRLTKKGIRRTWYAATLKESGPCECIQTFVDLLKDSTSNIRK